MTMYRSQVIDSQLLALPTVDTASGSIATFDTDMTENLVEVKCQIVAQQGGSGTPSPDNERPITTYTEMNVCHSGINLFDESTYVTGHSYIDISNLKIGATYTILAKNPSGIALFKISESSGSTPIWQSLSVSGTTFTVTQAMLDIGKLWIINSSYQTATVEEIQTAKISLNYPSTDTEYHAYNGNIYNIPFGQTVANGVLNVTTGKLRVTHGYVELDGSNDENWTYTGTRFICTTSDMLSRANRTNVISNRGVFDAYSTADGTIFGFNGSIYYYLLSVTSLADFKTWLSNNHLQVVYPLETSYDIQLDSVQIQALLNENNIWCDTGDTEVKYLLTVGKKIA